MLISVVFVSIPPMSTTLQQTVTSIKLH